MAQQKQYTWTFDVLTKYLPEEAKITGPMAPVLMAQKIAELLEEQLWGVIRVNFKEDRKGADPTGAEYLYNLWEGPPKQDNRDHTHHDHLIVVLLGAVIFIVDGGDKSYQIGACFGPNDYGFKDPKQPFIEVLEREQLYTMLGEAYMLGFKILKETRKLSKEVAHGNG